MERPNYPFFSAVKPILGKSMNCKQITMRQFKSTFGVSLEICYKIWKVYNWEKMVKKTVNLGADVFTDICHRSYTFRSSRCWWINIMKICHGCAWVHWLSAQKSCKCTLFHPLCLKIWCMTFTYDFFIIIHYRLILKTGTVIVMVELS